VTPVAVMTEPRQCPGNCVYCPSYEATPRSYTPGSPAVLRARACEYDAKKQVSLRLKVLEDMGHPTDKIELIVMGGTFLAYPVDYQYQFIKDCYDALNGAPAPDLAAAQHLNETARHRCTGLCIETRPDWCRAEDVARMLEFGTTRVELGVQTLDDEIYKLVRRGHRVEDVVAATARLRRAGLKVHYHWMPGLPGSTPEHDLALSRLLFEDERFRPDGLKLYPTVVVEGTELEQWRLAGRYRPYNRDPYRADDRHQVTGAALYPHLPRAAGHPVPLHHRRLPRLAARRHQAAHEGARPGVRLHPLPRVRPPAAGGLDNGRAAPGPAGLPGCRGP